MKGKVSSGLIRKRGQFARGYVLLAVCSSRIKDVWKNAFRLENATEKLFLSNSLGYYMDRMGILMKMMI